MLVNYQTNNRQPSFGRFRFSNNAKEVVSDKIFSSNSTSFIDVLKGFLLSFP